MNVIARHAAILLLGMPLTALAAAPQPTHEYTLDNGLKVIVREDHRAPVVVSQLWYKVGSSYETPGQTGLSHALEHMMFKGSRKLGPGESSRILRELGAEENAFTSDDYTAYYQVLARDRLPVALELEADRLASLRLPPEEFDREIEVVKEERRLRTDDRPSAQAYERFKAMAYPASGYRTPTIGWMADLDRMTVDELRAWYQTWYVPNNATLVVVGDVTGEEVKRLAERSVASTREIINVVGNVQRSTEDATVLTRDILRQITDSVTRTSELVGEVYTATQEQSSGAEQILSTSTHMQTVTRQLASAAREQASGARDMMKAVEVMNRMTQQVADASSEQKQGGDLVVKAVERIAQIAQQNLAAAEQLSKNTHNLSQEAERLLSVAEVFTLGDETVPALEA